MMHRIQRHFTLLITMLLSSTSAAESITRPVGEPCSSMFNYKGKVYFCADHPLYGKELHVADGGRFTTKLVSNLDPGLGGSNPFGFFELRDHLYFFAETTADGYALWRTDGSRQGTKRIRSISADFNVYPSPLPSINGKRETIVAEIGNFVYFEGFAAPQETDWRAEPLKLFRTDGTQSGTVEIKDTFLVGGFASSISGWHRTSYQVFNNELFYISYGELHRVDQNDAHKIADLPFSNSGLLTEFSNIVFNGNFLISANGSLWRSNGTSQGTQALGDIDEPNSVIPLAVIGSNLLYKFFGPNNDTQIRVAEAGADNTLITEPSSSLYLLSQSNPEFDSQLLFRTQDKTISTNGAAGGTLSVNRTNINFPRQLGNIFFAFNDAVNPNALVTFSPQSLVVNTIKTGLNESSMVGESSSGVLFTDNPSRYSTHLWVSDGTSIGTRLIKRLSGTSYRMNGVHQEGGRAYMINLPNANGSARELWHSDGTSNGTYRLDFRYDNGENPNDSAQGKAIPPVLNLLLDDEV